MPVAAAIAGAGVVTGLLGYKASEDASKAQAQAAANALAFQKQVYDQNQANIQPFITAGTGATSTLSALNRGDMSSFYLSPDYNFAFNQGMRGLTAYENAKGMGLSGGALKDVTQFASGLATQNYGNFYNRLMSLATLGSGSASGLSNTNANMSGTIGNTTMGMGQATASGIVGGANAITGGINSGMSNALLYNFMNKNQGNPSAYAAGAGDAVGGTGLSLTGTGGLY